MIYTTLKGFFVRKRYYLAMIASRVLKMEMINSSFFFFNSVPGIFSPCANNEGQGPAQPLWVIGSVAPERLMCVRLPSWKISRVLASSGSLRGTGIYQKDYWWLEGQLSQPTGYGWCQKPHQGTPILCVICLKWHASFVWLFFSFFGPSQLLWEQRCCRWAWSFVFS